MKRDSKYRIRNWADYNKSMIQRGSITIWFSEDVIKGWTEKSSSNASRGRPRLYSDQAILTALILRAVFHLPLRALQGFLTSLVCLLRVDLPIPHYSRICRRASEAGKQIKRLSRKRPTDLVFDSSGLKVYGEGEWKVRQHGKSKRRTWRKVHLAICPDTHEIVLETLTENNIADCTVMADVCDQIPGSVEKVYGDGAYDTSECREALVRLGIEPIIPPQKNAVSKTAPLNSGRSHRNEGVAEISGLGGDDAARKLWKKLKGYHRRSLVETAMYRFKALIGGSLRSRRMPNQKAEVLAACLAINKMTGLGMPLGEWI